MFSRAATTAGASRRSPAKTPLRGGVASGWGTYGRARPRLAVTSSWSPSLTEGWSCALCCQWRQRRIMSRSGEPSAGLRLLLVDDQQLMRQGLRTLLEMEEGMTIVA